MSRTDPVQCALCGWTGQADDLDLTDEPACPACGEAVAASS